MERHVFTRIIAELIDDSVQRHVSTNYVVRKQIEENIFKNMEQLWEAINARTV